MNYRGFRDALQALPLCGSREEVATAVLVARKYLGNITLHASMSADGWVKYIISNNDKAHSYEVDMLTRLARDGRFVESEYYSIHPNVARGIKAIYYGVGHPRVVR